MSVVITPVIGIPNWPWKKKVIECVKKNPNIYELEIRDFCFECSRHMELLNLFDKENSIDFCNTEYYKYQRRQKRRPEQVIDKIEGFRRLYRDIGKNGCRVAPIVTDDGCRLNGSHRLSILIYMGIKAASINVGVCEAILGDKEAKKIRQSVSEYRKKVYQL